MADLEHADGDGQNRSRSSVAWIDPMVLSLVLLCVALVGGAVYAWRYLELAERPASTYYESQIQRWEQLLTENPDDPAIWSTLGSLYFSSGDVAAADRAYKRVLELDPDSPTALVHEAKKLRDAGDTAAARDLFKKAIQLLPQGGRYGVLFDLGEMERAVGQDDAAIAAYEESVQDNSTFWNASFQLALLYEKAGRSDEALGAALQARRFLQDDQRVADLISRLESSGATATAPAKTRMDGDD